jgi:hypothetical protein
MKIIITIILAILSSNIMAEEYKLIVNKKHYENSIIIKPTEPTDFVNPFTEIGFFKVDYLTEGDNLLTLDTSTGIEWLNLNVTSMKSVTEVLADPLFSNWRIPTK